MGKALGLVHGTRERINEGHKVVNHLVIIGCITTGHR